MQITSTRTVYNATAWSVSVRHISSRFTIEKATEQGRERICLTFAASLALSQPVIGLLFTSMGLLLSSRSDLCSASDKKRAGAGEEDAHATDGLRLSSCVCASHRYFRWQHHSPQDTQVAIETSSVKRRILVQKNRLLIRSPHCSITSESRCAHHHIHSSERKEGRKQRACEGGYSPFATESKFSSWYTYFSSYWRDPFSLFLSLSLSASSCLCKRTSHPRTVLWWRCEQQHPSSFFSFSLSSLPHLLALALPSSPPARCNFLTGALDIKTIAFSARVSCFFESFICLHSLALSSLSVALLSAVLYLLLYLSSPWHREARRRERTIQCIIYRATSESLSSSDMIYGGKCICLTIN